MPLGHFSTVSAQIRGGAVKRRTAGSLREMLAGHQKSCKMGNPCVGERARRVHLGVAQPSIIIIGARVCWGRAERPEITSWRL